MTPHSFVAEMIASGRNESFTTYDVAKGMPALNRGIFVDGSATVLQEQ